MINVIERKNNPYVFNPLFFSCSQGNDKGQTGRAMQVPARCGCSTKLSVAICFLDDGISTEGTMGKMVVTGL